MSDDLMRCVAGCKIFAYNEAVHHKHCPHYPETLTKHNDLKIKKLKEAFPRMRRTLKILCTCTDGGVNNLVSCQACRFKDSFNQDLEI